MLFLWPVSLLCVQGADLQLVFQGLLNAEAPALEEDPEAALESYETELERAVAAGESSEIAAAHARLGEAAFLLGDHFRALTHHRAAHEIYRELGDDVRAAAALSRIGSTYYFSQAGDLDKAREAYLEAAEGFAAIGMQSEAALNLNYSAYVEWARGREKAALKIHREALDRFESIGDREGMATALSDIGFTLNSLGRHKEALDHSLRALELERELEKPLMRIPTLNNIGIAYLGLGQLEKALEFSMESYRMATERKVLMRRIEASKTMHEIYAALGRWEEAYAMLAEHKRLNDRTAVSEQARRIVEHDLSAVFRERQQRLRKESEAARILADERLRREQSRNLALWTVLLLAAALLIVLWRHIRSSRRANLLLAVQQRELHAKNAALSESLEKLRQSQSEIIRMEKNATLGVLTAGAAHEINNPMNVIRGALYGIQDELESGGTADPRELRVLAEQIEAGVRRTSKIIEGLYAFSRQSDALQLTCLDAGEVLRAAVERFRHRRSDCVRLEIDGEGGFTVLADRSALSQIICNLLENACDAIAAAEDGEVRLRMRELPGDWIEIEVADNGCGMDESQLGRIYDPFFTTKPTGQGIGIGLTFAYRLAVDLGGSIQHRINDSGGITATLRLPKYKQRDMDHD
ncbi:MAG: tetratricopeptide repeat protein [Verrucomicrobiota bacterium]